MEQQFELRYYANKKMLAEFARKYSVGPRWPVVIGFAVIYAYLLIFCVLGQQLWEMLAFVIAIGIVMFLIAFMPQWYTWLTLRNVKKQNDGVQPETIVTFGDIIEMHEGMVHLTIEYRKIKKVIRLKYSYMLMLGKRNGVMLAPDSFTKGTFEEFKQFLREKRPDLVIPE